MVIHSIADSGMLKWLPVMLAVGLLVVVIPALVVTGSGHAKKP